MAPSTQTVQAPLPFVAEQLTKAAAIYAERSAMYGDNYKRFGHIMMGAIGPVTLETVADFNRFAIFTLMGAKLSRYGNNFTKGGHDDSLDDMAVYCMMLKELDAEEKAKKVEGAA